jgi:hypothetical protein
MIIRSAGRSAFPGASRRASPRGAVRIPREMRPERKSAALPKR